MASGVLSEQLNLPDVDPIPGGYQKFKFMGYRIFDTVSTLDYINRLNAPITTPLPYTGAGLWWQDLFSACMTLLEGEAVTPFDPAPSTWVDPSAEIITWSYKLDASTPDLGIFQLAMNVNLDIFGTGIQNFPALELKLFESISSYGVPFSDLIEQYLEETDGKFEVVAEMYKSIE